MRRQISRMLVLCLLLMVTACSSVKTKTQDSSVQVDDKVLVAIGHSSLRQSPQLTSAQNKFAIEQNAKIGAYRELAKQIFKLNVAEGVLVAHQVIKNEAYRVYLDLFLREAKVVSSKVIADQKEIALALTITPRFYECFSTTVVAVSSCLQEDNKIPFTRVGYQYVPKETVNLACSDCMPQLSVSGFSNKKHGFDGFLLDAGLYDSEWAVNMATRLMLRYFFASQFVINSSYHP